MPSNSRGSHYDGAPWAIAGVEVVFRATPEKAVFCVNTVERFGWYRVIFGVVDEVSIAVSAQYIFVLFKVIVAYVARFRRPFSTRTMDAVGKSPFALLRFAALVLTVASVSKQLHAISRGRHTSIGLLLLC